MYLPPLTSRFFLLLFCCGVIMIVLVMDSVQTAVDVLHFIVVLFILCVSAAL